jgi:hypothetical protein
MYSFHSLISFLPLFCNCQFRRVDSFLFFCSQAHILAGWRLETPLDYFSTEVFIITCTGQAENSLPFVGKACLQHRCIATEVNQLLLAYSRPRECVYRVFATMNIRIFWLRNSGFRVSCHNMFLPKQSPFKNAQDEIEWLGSTVGEVILSCWHKWSVC